MLGGAFGVSSVLPVLSGTKAWEVVAASGQKVIASMRAGTLTADQRAALQEHEHELTQSVIEASRYRYLASRAVVILIVLAIAGSGVLALLASRVAGHLSRQLSRPLSELVEWTELIARGEPLPAGPPQRGAPEFEVMRARMREMADQIAAARRREIEAQRLEAFRETARQVAHELKNPLTPIGLAVARLKREGDPKLAEIVDVLDTETRRLDAMARSFAQFGRLPEGPSAAIDVTELARAAAEPLRRRARAHERAAQRRRGVQERRLGGGARVARGARRRAGGGDPRVRHGTRDPGGAAPEHLGALHDHDAGGHRTRPRDRAADGARARRRGGGIERAGPRHGDPIHPAGERHAGATQHAGGEVDMNEDIVVPIAGMITGIVIVIGVPLAIVYARRLWITPPVQPPSREVIERLERMEHAIDSIAVEVERISEGQRFTTKLLSDRETEAARALPPRRDPGA